MSKLVTTLVAPLFLAGDAFALATPATPATPATSAIPAKPAVAPTADAPKKADAKADSKAGEKNRVSRDQQ